MKLHCSNVLRFNLIADASELAAGGRDGRTEPRGPCVCSCHNFRVRCTSWKTSSHAKISQNGHEVPLYPRIIRPLATNVLQSAKNFAETVPPRFLFNAINWHNDIFHLLGRTMYSNVFWPFHCILIISCSTPRVIWCTNASLPAESPDLRTKPSTQFYPEVLYIQSCHLRRSHQLGVPKSSCNCRHSQISCLAVQSLR